MGEKLQMPKNEPKPATHDVLVKVIPVIPRTEMTEAKETIDVGTA